jgi:hypothetical protein
MSIHFYTMQEACNLLRCSPTTIKKMAVRGLLRAIEVQNIKNRPSYRILIPPSMLEVPHIDNLPILSTVEVAEILGVSSSRVRQLMMAKILIGTPAIHLPPKAPESINHKSGIAGSAHYFSVAQIRQYLGKVSNKPGKTVRLQAVIDWAKKRLEFSPRLDLAKDEMDEWLDEILKLPEPQKSMALFELYDKADRAKLVINRRPSAS